MVKHIVVFKLKEGVPQEEKNALIAQFKKAIESLPAQIPVIRKIEVGFNINPKEDWHIALYSEFDSLEDVKTYAVHPGHVAAGKILAGIRETRACVDYQF
jgi:hypothetical protein